MGKRRKSPEHDPPCLAERNLHVVRRALRSLGLAGFKRADRDDIEAAGFLGLVEAAVRFRPEEGVPFAGYAYPRIRGAMLDEMRRLRKDRPLPLDPFLYRLRSAQTGADGAETLLRSGGILSPRERLVLRWSVVQDIPQVEIARRLGVSPGRVSQIKQESITKLRREIQNPHSGPP